jgi:hypothetical protein
MLLFLMAEKSRYRGPTTLPESHPMTDGGGHMLSTGKFQSGTTFRRGDKHTHPIDEDGDEDHDTHLPTNASSLGERDGTRLVRNSAYNLARRGSSLNNPHFEAWRSAGPICTDQRLMQILAADDQKNK